MLCKHEVLPPRRGHAVNPESQSPLPSRGRALLEEHFSLVQKRLRQLSRTSGLPEHEADEFCSWALFRLVENEYRILGSWEGRSSFATYLTIALANLMRDYRIHVWGKWRPSAAAQRQGWEAVLLERLRFRDHLPLSEAVSRVLVEHGSSLSRAELERIAGSLSERSERRFVGEEALLRIAVDGNVDDQLILGEGAQRVARLQERLPTVLRDLPAEDRLLLKLHFRDGLTIATISHLLRLPQKQLYSRRDRCLKKLRQSLQPDALGSKGVSEILDCSWWERVSYCEMVWE
ncbi:MAG TPA: sigma-70 family RNA polymerase sigma factor [Thermoanaerobaculia bacterium]|jgi:RNA polymerase sigma factor (sigma-70 family)|nr:sigma-70 family RNA polymerase sigma factor [Thermoanaerobaculia bacterium]